MKIRRGFVCVLGMLVAGACHTARVTPVGLLSTYPDAVMFYGAPEKPRSERVVLVRKLTEVMAGATWTSEEFISKGGFWLRYPNGREFFFAVGFDFFRERNVRGSFVVRTEDLQRYRAAIEEIHRDLRTGTL